MTDLSASSVRTATPVASDHSYVDWAAIIAGAVLATAISFVLFTFSAALGLGMSSPYEGEGVSVAAFAIAAGLWIVWVQVLSFAAGGYLTGRMRRRAYDSTEHEVDVRDGIHGLLVWATGALLGAALAASAAGGAAAASSDTSVNSMAAAIAESSVEAVAGEDATVGDAVGEELTQAEEVRADAVRRWTIIAAFVAAASLLISAVAAFFTAGLGGRHRDQGLIVPFFQRQQWK
ncbi:Mll5186 protein [alpha proteobacterium U9-1i]|nr:Mll5186 protein [alpha proteobacterium U9-1i]